MHAAAMPGRLEVSGDRPAQEAVGLRFLLSVYAQEWEAFTDVDLAKVGPHDQELLRCRRLRLVRCPSPVRQQILRLGASSKVEVDTKRCSKKLCEPSDHARASRTTHKPCPTCSDQEALTQVLENWLKWVEELFEK